MSLHSGARYRTLSPRDACRSGNGMNATRRSILGVQWPGGAAAGASSPGMADSAPEDGGARVDGLAPAVDGSPMATVQSGDGDKKGSFERELQQFGEEVR